MSRKASQAWDLAEHSCGRCGEKFTATTEADFVERYSGHQAAHALVDQMTPEMRALLRRLLGE
jgi:hypothetical protein